MTTPEQIDELIARYTARMQEYQTTAVRLEGAIQGLQELRETLLAQKPQLVEVPRDDCADDAATGD